MYIFTCNIIKGKTFKASNSPQEFEQIIKI